MGFSRQEYWSGLPFPPPGDFPDPGIKPRSTVFPTMSASLHIPSPGFFMCSKKSIELKVASPALGGSVVKNLPASAEDAGNLGSIVGSGSSPGGRNGNPL